jgi:hypothetical protein
MKPKTLKRTLWIAALALALLMTLAVLPGLSYEVKGPWESGIKKQSQTDSHQFWLRLPIGQVYYCYWREAGFRSFIGPEGVSLTDGQFNFRFRDIEVNVSSKD